MNRGIKSILTLLKAIYDILFEIRDTYLYNHKIKGETLDKFEVMRILKISDSTYRRYVSKGILNPMGLDGVDIYYEQDLARALEESRRKGRF